MQAALEQHCREINRCNQRGGRMLSIVDLLEAGTFSTDLAAYCLAAISRGASFMVGALPGGAGKTTVMGALLNFVPPGVELHAADSLPTLEWAAKFNRRRSCYICHEIGTGHYFAYLWGEPLRAYFELLRHGHMLATNLHADSLEDARRQICDENQVPTVLFRRMNLVLFIEFAGGWHGRRVVSQLWESDGRQEHQMLYDGEEFRLRESRLVSVEAMTAAHALLQAVLDAGVREIREVRQVLLKPIDLSGAGSAGHVLS
ncbi:MAG: hypothetical protein N3J91_16070 [Verrucomicrobiae bacterium]|nr:hypothetical protein [Verrucomicrobiae bacterium]